MDRLWPRGVSKDKAKVDLWLSDTAPSHELRKWFSHDPKKWQAFKGKHNEALRRKQKLLLEIRQAEKEKGTVTFLYSARDEKCNQAAALLAFLREAEGS